MTQTKFLRLRAQYVSAAMKRAHQRTELFLMVETASSIELVRKAANQYFDECLKFDRLLEVFIARLEEDKRPSP